MKKKKLNSRLLLNKKVISDLHKNHVSGGGSVINGEDSLNAECPITNNSQNPDCGEITIDFYMCGESVLNICNSELR